MPGGWAFVIVREEVCILTGSGADARTTNNLMELQGALAAMRAVLVRGWHRSGNVELVSDSRFTLEIASGGYLPTKNLELANVLREACVEAGASTRWVR